MSFASPMAPPARAAKGGIPAEIDRDQYGRPKIIPPDGGEAVPYTRASNMGKVLDSEEGLTYWSNCMVVLGMGRRFDLVEHASALNSYEEHKSKLNEIARDAKSAAETSKSSNRGSALHGWIDRINSGEDFFNAPPTLQPTLASYFNAMSEAGIATIAREQFVVIDELQVAGTFDALYQVVRPSIFAEAVECNVGDLIIGDEKSGGPSTTKYPHKFAIQMAMYAHGSIYSETEVNGVKVAHRTPLAGVRKDIGLLVHCELDKPTALYRISLTEGWAMGPVANQVREWHKTKVLSPWVPYEAPVEVAP